MPDQSLSGQCLCGALKYVAKAPLLSLICHCKNCQRQSGSAFSIVMLVHAANVRYDGQLAAYLDDGDSGARVERLFCPTCGSAIASRCNILPNIDFIKCGTLDDTASIKPVAQIYCKSAQSWVDLAVANKFPKSLPQDAFRLAT